jgi:hypothetical protein
MHPYLKKARHTHGRVFSECTLKQPLVTPITIGNVLCRGGATFVPSAVGRHVAAAVFARIGKEAKWVGESGRPGNQRPEGPTNVEAAGYRRSISDLPGGCDPCFA